MDVVFAKLTLETLWLSDRASEPKFDGLQIPFLVGDSNFYVSHAPSKQTQSFLRRRPTSKLTNDISILFLPICLCLLLFHCHLYDLFEQEIAFHLIPVQSMFPFQQDIIIV